MARTMVRRFVRLVQLLVMGALAVTFSLAVLVGWQRLSGAAAFTVKNLELRGHGRLDQNTILAAAGIRLGEPLLALNLGACAAALQSHPWIERVHLRRHLPDRLHLELVEHVPRALVMLDELWVVNTRGETFKRFEPADRLDLPIISGLTQPLTPEPSPLAAAKNTRKTLGARAGPKKDQAALSLKKQLAYALGLLDGLSALQEYHIRVDELHHDADLGWSCVIVLGDAKGFGSHWPQALTGQAVTVNMGHSPQQRHQQLLATLQRLADRGQMAQVIWLDAVRSPQRVVVSLTNTSDASAEKSQSVGSGRRMSWKVRQAPRPGT